MLETFRKYTGLMFVVLILLFIGLVFFGSSGQGLSGPKVATAHGRGFNEKQYRRFAVNPPRLINSLASLPTTTREGGSALRSYFLFVISTGGTDYLVNRLSLQMAMREFGVYTSTTEVEEFLKNHVFWKDGAFDQQGYVDFEKNELKPLGMTIKNLNEITGEVLALEKLQGILGSGVESSRAAVLADNLSSRQLVSYQLVTFPLTKFETDLDPPEEDIKAKWEENKETYLSDPMRKISYIIARPDYAKIVAEKEGTSTDEEAPKDDSAAPDEDPKPDEKPESKLSTIERQQAVTALGNEFDDLLDQLFDGGELSELATKLGYDLKTTELLAKDDLPPELSGRFRDTIGSGPDAIFAGDPAKPQVFGIGSDQWLFFKIDEVVEAEELDYETARDEVRLDLIKELATEAMKKEAEAKHKALSEAMTAGKSFADAAKELDLRPVSRTEVSRTGAAGGTRSEYNHCIKFNPGTLTDVFTDQNPTLGLDRAFFLHVDKREVYEDENIDALVDAQVEGRRSNNQRGVLLNWFAHRRAEADLQQAATQ